MVNLDTKLNPQKIKILFHSLRSRPYGVMDKVLDHNVIISKFQLKLGKSMSRLIHPRNYLRVK